MSNRTDGTIHSVIPAAPGWRTVNVEEAAADVPEGEPFGETVWTGPVAAWLVYEWADGVRLFPVVVVEDVLEDDDCDLILAPGEQPEDDGHAGVLRRRARELREEMNRVRRRGEEQRAQGNGAAP